MDDQSRVREEVRREPEGCIMNEQLKSLRELTDDEDQLWVGLVEMALHKSPWGKRDGAKKVFRVIKKMMYSAHLDATGCAMDTHRPYAAEQPKKYHTIADELRDDEAGSGDDGYVYKPRIAGQPETRGAVGSTGNAKLSRDQWDRIWAEVRRMEDKYIKRHHWPPPPHRRRHNIERAVNRELAKGKK
jgi:hypothetical protein